MIHIGTAYTTLLNKSFAQNVGQWYNLCKFKYLSLEEVKIVYFQK